MGYGLFFVVVDRTKHCTDLLILEVNIEPGTDWQIYLDIGIKSSDVALVIERCDESNLALGLGRVYDVDVSGSIDCLGNPDLIVVSTGKFGVSVDLSLTADGEKSGCLQGVDKWQSHCSGEADGYGVLVVKLGVVKTAS